MRRFCILSLSVITILGFWIFTPALAPLYSGSEGEAGIDRGFLFLDGRYVEAPYFVERRDLAVYVNGNLVTEPLSWPPYSEYYFDHDPGIPQGISRETTIKDAIGVREPSGMLFDTAKQWYLFTHLDFDEAYERMAEYYRSLPCVKSMYREGGVWVLESYRSEKVRISFGGSRMRKVNDAYGPGGGGVRGREEYIEMVERRRSRFKERLRKGDCIIHFDGGREISMAERRAANLLPEMLAVMRSPSLSDLEKENELYSLGVIPRMAARMCRGFIAGFEAGPQIDRRLEALRAKLEQNWGPGILGKVERDSDLRVKFEKSSRLRAESRPLRPVDPGAAYSPDGNYLYGWCGYTYDPAFMFFDEEIAAVGDDIKDQDYNVTLYIYADTGDRDGDCEDCTYDNLKGMQYSDFLYYACHGEPSWGGNYIEMVLLETKEQIDYWSGYDTNYVVPVEITSLSWPTGHPWAATGTSAWPENYLSAMLTQSNAVTVLSCCYSYENGWVAACGGGVGFGYNTSCSDVNCMTNNDWLLERMNGTVDDGRYRRAGQAYDNMPLHLDQFRIEPENAGITLCPSPEYRYPEGEADFTGTGHFQVDTYCHDNVPADGALSFETKGLVTISNVNWVGTDSVCRIEFDWVGGCNFSVTVTAHADSFRSWGALSEDYHVMDGDSVAPNGDDVVWEFFREDPGTAVELDSFDATGYEQYIDVAWRTAYEIENEGFNLYRAVHEEGERIKINQELIPTEGNGFEGASYSSRDYDVTAGITYYYWVENVDLQGGSKFHGPVSAALDWEPPLPDALRLVRNYPNPFRLGTVIEYDLPRDCHVRLEVYNVLGRRVVTLVSDYKKAGRKVFWWNGKDENGLEATSGIYFCRLQAYGCTDVKKVVLIR